jgi:hypothetical protein
MVLIATMPPRLLGAAAGVTAANLLTEAASEGAGTGATFTVRLPLAAPETIPPQTAAR